MNRLILKIRELIDQKFWGELTIKFKDGRPTLITTTRTENLEKE